MHIDLHKTGLRIMESKEGDVCIYDTGHLSGVKGKLWLRCAMIERAKESEHERALLMTQFLSFLDRHREMRNTELRRRDGR